MERWYNLKQGSKILTVADFYQICTDLSLNKLQYNLSQPAIKTNIWIGYSGGVDSRVLLELAKCAFTDETKYNLIAVYINHHISSNASFWEQHCQQICQQIGINLRIKHIRFDVAKLRQVGSLECLLRQERLSIWQKLLGYNDILLLAHHLDDQIETIFLRLFRGSGLRGLSGIKAANYLHGIKIIRPLLDYTKNQLLDFANHKNLKYIDDESNNDQNIARNFIRHRVLPPIFNRWPHSIYRLQQTIDLLDQTDKFITKLAVNLLQDCYNYCLHYYMDNRYQDLRTLSITKLLKYERFLQIAILREFIHSKGMELPSFDKIELIYKEVISAKADRNPKLKIGNYFICRYRDNIYLYSKDYFYTKNVKNSYNVHNLVIEKENNKVAFNSSGKARKIFQTFAVPPWLRSNYALIYCKQELIAVSGLWHKEI